LNGLRLFLAMLTLGFGCASRPLPPNRMQPRGAFAGPAGVTWAMTRQEATKVLGFRFAFAGQRTFPDSMVFTYKGSFAGFEAEEVKAFFVDDHLSLLMIALPEKDFRTASQRWERMVEEMTTSQGPPTKLRVRPPGEFATWSFTNGAEISIVVDSMGPEDHGRPRLQPLWLFLSPRAAARLKVERGAGS